ncbi:MAG: VOC family protein [Planctomycetes bacterium]|nr:VOC family protein [Planctomycetota bacterium]
MAKKKQKPAVGSIAWRDLTVKDADSVGEFYAKVVGWKVEPVEMGGYRDYCMVPPGAKAPEAGVCHKRGVNAKFPSQWLMYIVVADIEKSLAHCAKLGGEQLTPVTALGNGLFAVIRDPAGAVCALYEVRD